MMRRFTTAALAVLCTAILALSLAACGARAGDEVQSGGGTPASEGTSTSAVSVPQENSAGNSYTEVELSEGIYYVEAAASGSDPGDHPSVLDSAKMVGEALLWTDLPNLAEGRNIYVIFIGVETVNDADACVYAISMGSEFDPQDYETLYYLAADYEGKIYSMSDDDSGEWKLWQTTWEIETGVIYIDRPEIEERAMGSEPDFYPQGLTRATYIWEDMKEHGTPDATAGRVVIFRLIAMEYYEDEDHFTCFYSVELDYGDGANPLFYVSIDIAGDVMCNWGESWQELPYGDMLGGEKAVLPEDASGQD